LAGDDAKGADIIHIVDTIGGWIGRP